MSNKNHPLNNINTSYKSNYRKFRGKVRANRYIKQKSKFILMVYYGNELDPNYIKKVFM